MILANDSNLKIVNSGHFQALVRKVSEYLMSIRNSSTVCMPNFFYQLNLWEHWLSSSLVSPQWSIEKPPFMKHFDAHGMSYFNEPQIRNKTGRL